MAVTPDSPPRPSDPPAAASAPERTGRGGAAARLEGARALLGRLPDGEIAERLGIARKTVVEFRKRHQIEAFVAARARPGEGRGAKDAPGGGGAAGRDVAGREALGREGTGQRRASKLDGFLHLVGRLPDREVAERAGMTTENVRMYRQRRGIAAGWRAPVEAPEAERPKRGRQPAAPGETRVERALAAVAHLIGSVPDAEVAAQAGISRSAVSAYRQKHQIPPGGVRGGARAAREEGAREGVAREEGVRPGSASEVAGRSTGGVVFRIRAERGGVESTFGLVAADPVEAMQRAWAALTARDERWVLLALERVGGLLDEGAGANG